MVDSFEMAKGQLKTETEGEKKIDAAYQVRYQAFIQVPQEDLGCVWWSFSRACCAHSVLSHKKWTCTDQKNGILKESSSLITLIYALQLVSTLCRRCVELWRGNV